MEFSKELSNVQIPQPKDDAGQATVEFALLLPMFVTTMAVLVSVIGIGLSSFRLTDMTRVAARAASTSDDPSHAVQMMIPHRDISHRETLDATQQFLTVELRQNIRIPILRIPIPKIVLTARSTVLLEGMPILQE